MEVKRAVIAKRKVKEPDNETEEVGSSTQKSNNRPKLLSSIYNYLIVVLAILVVFAAFRNSVTWHLQVFWGKSGELWQHLWDKFIDFAGEDEFNLFVWWTTAYTFLVYWVFGAIYTIMDITKKPKFLQRYKIQQNANEKIETKRILQVISNVLINQFAVGIPFAYLSYYAMTFRGIENIRTLPQFHWVVLQVAIFILVEEFGFYYSHRVLHSKRVYKYIHKKHHEWTSPISVTAIYCHPVEHFFSNILPPFLGILICGSHIATAWLWFTMVTLSTLNAHCGYHFPFFPSPEAHDFHHLKFNYNFGMLGLLDRIHGTDTLFRNSPQGNRHIMLLSFLPAIEQFPEKPKKSL